MTAIGKQKLPFNAYSSVLNADFVGVTIVLPLIWRSYEYPYCDHD
jgi:hypothetical protein